MRKLTYLYSLFLALLVLLAASCGSSRSFSSRKYTAGKYVSPKHKAGNVSIQKSPEREPALVAKDETASCRDMAAANMEHAATGKASPNEKAGLPKDELAATDNTALGMRSSETKKASSEKSTDQKAELKKTEAFKAERLQKYIADRTARKAVASGDDDGNALDPVALVSFILGIIGLVMNIVAISVIVATAEYVFALLFIAGMVLGIIALVFGTQGLRRHRKNNGSTINLVFSIIGTAFGGAAIISAFVFAFYTLILAIAGL